MLLGSDNGIVLDSIVGALYGVSVGYFVGFKDGNIYVTLDGKSLGVDGRLYPIVESWQGYWRLLTFNEFFQSFLMGAQYIWWDVTTIPTLSSVTS